MWLYKTLFRSTFFLFILIIVSTGISAQKPDSNMLRSIGPTSTVPKTPAAIPKSDTTSDTARVSGYVHLGGGNADLSGTSVEVRGGPKGVVFTDSAGHFIIKASKTSILIFSHIGYLTTEIDVKDRLSINVTLDKEPNTLEQVTVSYGKQVKRDITGAITKIDAGSVQDIPATEFGQKLQGQVSGVQILQTSGIPGNNITFRIRGA